MEVELSTMRKVIVKGFKSQWQVPNADVIFVDLMPFIRLRTQSWTLLQIILENNPDAQLQAGKPKAFLLLAAMASTCWCR